MSAYSHPPAHKQVMQPEPGFPRVSGYCPMGCGQTLFLGSDGRVTCSWRACPNPSAADESLTTAPRSGATGDGSEVWRRRVETLEEALRAIAEGFDDPASPGYRAGFVKQREIARAALSGVLVPPEGQGRPPATSAMADAERLPPNPDALAAAEARVQQLTQAAPEDTPELRHWLGSQDVIGNKTTVQIARAIHALMHARGVLGGREQKEAGGEA